MTDPFPGGTLGDPGYWEVIFDVIPFPVYVADVATYQIICANRAMRQKTGANVGDKCYQAVYRQDHPCIFCKIPELMLVEGRPDNYVVFEHFNDVDDRWYHLRETLVSWFDGRRAKYSIAVDISAMKEVQNALVEAHAELAIKNRELASAVIQAREASRAKSEFLAVMSHEIRTPLNSIIGMVRLLLERPLAAQDRERLEIVGTSGTGLLTILNDILDFSRLEAGGLEFEDAPFNLGRAVDAVAKLMAPRAEEKGLGFKVERSESLPIWVSGDAARLRQVLLNLLGNALKFTAAGGVTLSAAAVPWGDGLVGVEFAVSDTGIGIDEDQQAQLFQPFTQAEASISRRFGGTGLGLAICKKLVESQGGAIGVTSTLGGGSRFWFRLAFRPAVAPAQRPAIEVTRLPPLSMLLAEDNVFNQKVALGLLARDGHRVTVAGDGAQAVALARGGGFDVILMDMQMPEVDGLEAARQIRALPGDVSRVPIIALTANAMRGDDLRCRQAGMNAHVAKPIDPEQLFRVIAEALNDVAHPGYTAPAPVESRQDSFSFMDMVDELGVEVALDLVRTFLSNGSEICQRLDDAGDNLDLVIEAAHDLKGLASYSGDAALTRLAVSLGKAAHAGDAVRVRQLVATLNGDWTRLKADVASRFDVPA